MSEVNLSLIEASKKPTKRELAKALGECQVLFGRILGEYRNDRNNAMRADKLEPLCITGQHLCEDILGNFPAEYSE